MRSRSQKLCRWNVEQTVCPHCGEKATSVHPDDLEHVQCVCGGWIETALGQRMRRRPTASIEQRTAERVN